MVAPAISIFAGPIFARLTNELSGFIKEQILLVWGVKKEVEHLHETLKDIQAVLADAEERQVKEQVVRNWLLKLQQAACDAEDLLDSFKTEAYLHDSRKQQQLVSNFPLFGMRKLSYKHKAAKRIKCLLERLDQINKDRRSFDLDRKATEEETWKQRNPEITGPSLNEKKVFGREDDKDKLIERLLSDSDVEGEEDNISIVPIIGMGGLGKTTLAQLVFNDPKVKERFENLRMWVCVTDEFVLTRIVREMIEFHAEMRYDLGLSLPQLQSRLQEFLKGKRFLLVLDDVWNVDVGKWDGLKTVLCKGGKGSKILVTSRNEKVCKIMHAREPYRLGVLPEDECWLLLLSYAFGRTDYPIRKDFEAIGKKIVHKCGCLPLAVTAMGGFLCDKENIDEWEAILEDELWKVEEQENDKLKVLPALKLSYYHLPSHLKQCFAFCSIFPKAYVFNKEDLVKLWMAEAFIVPRPNDPHEGLRTGLMYFSELLRRSFFQVLDIDNKVRYRMHDLIHDLASSISHPYCFQVKEPTSTSTYSNDSRHISLLCRDVKDPTESIIANSKKLRTLLLPTNYSKNFGETLLVALFSSLKYMRALDLSSSALKVLPDSIKELKLLRLLDLSKTEITELPNSVCTLSNLETLKLLGCLWLTRLPDDLGNLVNLSHLELDDMFWFKISTLPPRLGKLTKLCNLHAFIVGKDSGHGVGELENLSCLSGNLHISKLENAGERKESDRARTILKDKKKLEKLVLEWSKESNPGNEQVLLEDLEPHANLQQLQISYYKGSVLPTWLRDGGVQSLRTISLTNCTQCRALSIGQLPQLSELNLKGMQELEEWTETGHHPLSLRRLNISSCPKLKTLPDMFPNLWSLKIKKCSSLEALPMAPTMRFLILEDNAVLADWREAMVERRKLNEQEQVVALELLPSFLNLLELRIRSCPKMNGLPEVFAPQKLEIVDCELIRELLKPEFSSRMQHLALSGCNDSTLLSAIPHTASLYSMVIAKISNVVFFPKWPLLPGLKALYIHDCPDLRHVSNEEEGSLHSFVSLTFLSIVNCAKLETVTNNGFPLKLQCLSIGSCPNLVSLGPSGEILTSLKELTDLYVEDCPMLQLLESGVPASLQHLKIQNCPLLRDQRQKERVGITHIPDLEIGETKTHS